MIEFVVYLVGDERVLYRVDGRILWQERGNEMRYWEIRRSILLHSMYMWSWLGTKLPKYLL